MNRALTPATLSCAERSDGEMVHKAKNFGARGVAANARGRPLQIELNWAHLTKTTAMAPT